MAGYLNETDLLMILFGGLLSFLALFSAARIPYWPALAFLNLGIAIYIVALAWSGQKVKFRMIRWLHDWNAIPVILIYFKEVNILILGIYKGGTYDSLLISSDRQLFGGDPTLWLAHSASPGVTEVLQIAYSLFYLFFVVVGFELYTRDSSLFGRFRFAVTLGFFLSYAGYLMVPAVGPRFTLHEYSRIGSELPGLFFTPCLRRFVDFGDSIPAGASSALAYSLAQRDAFPSGHTMMTVIVAVLAFQWRARSRFFVLPAGVLLIAATVYLRYHYIVDILAGGLLAIVCLRTSPWLYRRFERYLRNASQI